MSRLPNTSRSPRTGRRRRTRPRSCVPFCQVKIRSSNSYGRTSVTSPSSGTIAGRKNSRASVEPRPTRTSSRRCSPRSGWRRPTTGSMWCRGKKIKPPEPSLASRADVNGERFGCVGLVHRCLRRVRIENVFASGSFPSRVRSGVIP